MMHNKFMFFLVPLLLCGCRAAENQDEVYEEEIIPVERSYSEVSDFELTWEMIFEVGEENYYVYFYSLTCSHCEELKNFIVETALERGDVYFVKGTSKDQITNDPKKTIGAENPGEIWILGYPSLLKITNQKCTKNLVGNTQIKSELK